MRLLPWLGRRLVRVVGGAGRERWSLVMLASFIILPLTLISITASPFAGIADSPGFLNPFTGPDDTPITALFVIRYFVGGLGAWRIRVAAGMAAIHGD